MPPHYYIIMFQLNYYLRPSAYNDTIKITNSKLGTT